MTALEKRIRDFVLWMRNNPHHYAGFNDNPDGTSKSFTLRGRAGSKTVAVSTFKAALPYFEVANGSEDRMFRPNEMGMQIINGELANFAPRVSG